MKFSKLWKKTKAAEKKEADRQWVAEFRAMTGSTCSARDILSIRKDTVHKYLASLAKADGRVTLTKILPPIAIKPEDLDRMEEVKPIIVKEDK